MDRAPVCVDGRLVADGTICPECESRLGPTTETKLAIALKAINAARSVFSEEKVREEALCFAMYAVFEELVGKLK